MTKRSQHLSINFDCLLSQAYSLSDILIHHPDHPCHIKHSPHNLISNTSRHILSDPLSLHISKSYNIVAQSHPHTQIFLHLLSLLSPSIPFTTPHILFPYLTPYPTSSATLPSADTFDPRYLTIRPKDPITTTPVKEKVQPFY